MDIVCIIQLSINLILKDNKTFPYKKTFNKNNYNLFSYSFLNHLNHYNTINDIIYPFNYKSTLNQLKLSLN